MSARLSLQTLLLADRLAQELQLEHKGDLHKDLLVQRLLAKIKKKEVIPEQMVEPEIMCQFVVNVYFKRQSAIRKRCEKQGDLFRPQMMVPVAPGILARFGTGSHLTVVGYQNETNKKAIGAVRILDRISAVNEHCNRLSTHLIAHPKWNILRVETEMLGYRLRDGDHEPFPIDGFSLDDDEDDEE